MLVHPQFDPIAFHIGPIAVRWYGLMYLVGFVLFAVLGKRRARQNLLTGWHPRDVDDMLFYGVFGVIIGGRLGYVLFYKPLYYLAHPLEILSVWQGGMSFHGGFLGVLVALVLFAQRRDKRWLDVTDFVAPLIPLGLAAGRIGNFINGELWGRVTDVPWGMVFPQAGPAAAASVAALPVRAARACCCSSCCGSTRGGARPMGAVSGLFLIGYGMCRFVAEYAREPDSFLGYLALGLTMGQWLSLPMIVAGAIDDELGVPARRQGAADGARPDEEGLKTLRRLIDPAEFAVERVAARASMRICARLAADVERQREQHERHQVREDARQQEQEARKHLAPAVEQLAQHRLLAVQCGGRVRAERDALVAQEHETRDRR